MNNPIPKYLYQRGNIVRLIVFTSFFALLFINIFKPFNSRSWYIVTDFEYLVYASLLVLVGMLVVVLSRIIMLIYVRHKTLTYLHYVEWILAEVLAMSMFYAVFTKFIPIQNRQHDFLQIFYDSALHASLILLLPYAFSWLYFSLHDKKILIANLKNEDKTTEVQKKSLIAFVDEKGEFKISIDPDNLLYIESADNYITIHYLNKSKLSHYMLRNTLKWMEENMIADTQLVRSHRSFIVNLDKVKVMRKTKDGIFLELDAFNTPDIPVSKTYYESVMTRFSDYSS